VPAEEFDQHVRQLRALLPRRTSREYRQHAARLYELLVRPIESQLGLRERDTLVFVPGGSLRTIPIAALYDRESDQFLVEKYPLAVIPGLQLIEPHAIDVQHARALLIGLTVATGGFPALKAVGSELEAIDASFESTRLVDQQFVADSIGASLSSEHFNIVHIATHAQFGDSPSNSFLLTYNGRLGLDDLSALIERTRYGDQPLELLTLSACETAAGDERAALGLAGIALRSGARSALATLWPVNDQAAAELIAEFYRQLASGGVSKAEALRRAQRALIAQRTYRHPGYWSPFVLISDWL
jgi:CHAT domain-containing protein